ncbi:MAG TPA: transcription elongation factor GreB [Crenotrichaceae bacterium]|nr:transcription elongation factor GreB [Crenotrichaceae bacterium]
MARYRPPAPPKSPYITAQGYQQLEQESKSLWLKRREVTKALAAAAAEGDRSENAEYIYRKKELREIDRRLRYLQTRLPKLRIIDQPPGNQAQVFFAAWVTLEDKNGNESIYRLVGPDEIDHQPNYISIDSPLAKSLIKCHLDEQITVETPGGKQAYWITAIRYTNK